MCAFAPYDLENVKVVGYDVVTNRPEGRGLPRAGRADLRVRGRERGRRDRQEARHRPDRAAPEERGQARAPRPPTGRSSGPSASMETLEAAKTTRALAHAARQEARAAASPPASGSTSAARPRVSLTVNEDGTLSLMAGTPDIGGLRASLCMMAADELGVPLRQGARRSSATPARSATTSSPAAAAPRSRAAWPPWRRRARSRTSSARAPPSCGSCQSDAGRVQGRRGAAGRRQRRQAQADDARGLRQDRRQDRRPDRRLRAHQRRRAPAPSLGTHIVDVEVDPETGKVDDPALHGDPGRRQGASTRATSRASIQGGAAQGIGWALNEEYIYGADGKLQNAGFLDYRMPVASDLPMIDTIIVEVPNPRHPYGVRGVGETPIVPPHGGHRQRHGRRHRRPLHRAADVAAQGAEGAQGARGRNEGLSTRMPRVVLVGNLAQLTGGVAEFQLSATSVKQLFQQLAELHPALAAAPRGGRGRGHRRADLPGRALRADRLRTARSFSSRRSPAADTACRQLGMQAVTVISISSSGEFSAATVTVVRAGLLVGKYLAYSSL